ncbi:hypothetical protein V1477_007289 [Vespula maculifrons]|uniref:Uncharacterized protein n=1 Tax=Vespula maculifrons TaxID=7453 RepID=A0ABD2CI39_VESMC
MANDKGARRSLSRINHPLPIENGERKSIGSACFHRRTIDSIVTRIQLLGFSLKILFDVFGRPPPISRCLPPVFVTFFRRPLTSTLPPPLEQSQSRLLLLDNAHACERTRHSFEKFFFPGCFLATHCLDDPDNATGRREAENTESRKDVGTVERAFGMTENFPFIVKRMKLLWVYEENDYVEPAFGYGYSNDNGTTTMSRTTTTMTPGKAIEVQ